jgi:hypothetical protein
MPEQVQDFYPTPGTLATCMWYTGIDPQTMKPVFVPKTPHDKALQRALMQWRKPQNRALVMEALKKTGRDDLIGYGKRCLIRPDKGAAQSGYHKPAEKEDKPAGKPKSPKNPTSRKENFDGRHRVEKKDPAQTGKPVRKAGWAKAKAPAKKGIKKKK